jgi:hypothetical protein
VLENQRSCGAGDGGDDVQLIGWVHDLSIRRP